MRLMAIDYGDARTGVAFSDATGTITGDAFIIKTLSLTRTAIKLSELAKEHGAEKIILGYPLNMDGTVGPRGETSKVLAGMLEEHSSLPVVLWDERRTTVEAHSILSEVGRYGKKRKEKVDAVAASLILEGYMMSDE